VTQDVGSDGLFAGLGHVMRTCSVAAVGFDLSFGSGHGGKTSLKMKSRTMTGAAVENSFSISVSGSCQGFSGVWKTAVEGKGNRG
jgi:hypothetical protein